MAVPTQCESTKAAHRGHFKVEEEAFRHLKRTFGEPAAYRKALVAYTTLLRLANLKQSDTFTERIGSIADDMGYAYNEAAKALKLVAMAGLCKIQTRNIPGTNEKDSSIYTVKRMFPENRGTLHEKQGRLPESQRNLAFPESTQEQPQVSPKKNSQEARFKKKTSTSFSRKMTRLLF